MGILADRLFGEQRLKSGARYRPGPGDARRAEIIKRWTYYFGREPSTGAGQWEYLYDRFQSMPRREIEDVENHTRICADRLRRLLVNSWRGFDIGNSDGGAAVRDVFARNRWPHLLNQIALTATVTGDAFIKIVPAGNDPRFGPVRFILLDTEAVTLDVSPHDRDDVRSAGVAYDYLEDDGRGGVQRRSYREVLTADRIDVFVDGVHDGARSGEHGLGFMPLVHVRNLDTGGRVYGESLVARLMDAQDTLNMLVCDLVDIVRYDGHKTTIFQNVNIDRGASRDGATAGEIDMTIGKGLVVKGDGKVYKLDQQHDLGAALEEYERKLDAFYDLAGVPRISRHMVSHLGSLSGRAVERLYQDAIDTTREAQGLYGESFRELACKTAAVMGVETGPVHTLWNTDVITPDVDTLKKEYELGTRSKRSLMRKLGIGDADRMLAEIAEEEGRDPLQFSADNGQ